MERMTKEELKMWANRFRNVFGFNFNPNDGEIKFYHPSIAPMTCVELCDRIRPLDPVFATKVATWFNAATDLVNHISSRLENKETV